MRIIKFWSSGALVLGAAMASACSNSSDSTSSGATASEIASYQQLTTQVQNGAMSYRTMMMGATNVADCRRIHDAYESQTRTRLSQMVQMGAGMDAYMRNHSGASVADMGCVSGTMMSELDHHHSVACTFTDLSANQSEAGRHVDAMLSYGGHAWDRCDQMMRGTTSGSWNWGAMMPGCQTWNGHDCCGGMMGRAGTMGGMHHDGCCENW